MPEHICGEDLGPKGDGHGENLNDKIFGPNLPENRSGAVPSTMERILERSRPTNAPADNKEADD